VPRGVRMAVVAGRYDESPSCKNWNHANLHSLVCWVPGGGLAQLWAAIVTRLAFTMLAVENGPRGIKTDVVACRCDEYSSNESGNHGNLHSLACWVPGGGLAQLWATIVTRLAFTMLTEQLKAVHVGSRQT
jgi:hypothetical protein